MQPAFAVHRGVDRAGGDLRGQVAQRGVQGGGLLGQQGGRVLAQLQVGERRALGPLPPLAREQLGARVAPAGGGLRVDLAAPGCARFRAGVGRGTLYRNFATRRDLLEALFSEEVDELIAAAVPATEAPGAALLSWLRRFAAFEGSKRVIATELLEYTDSGDPIFGSGRQRVIAAGEPLLTAAQRAGQIRQDVTLVQALDLVLAVAGLDREPAQVKALMQVALDGLRANPR